MPREKLILVLLTRAIILWLLTFSFSARSIPVVASSDWAIIDRMAYCLSISSDSVERRQICLILNNLSIPFDNKALMLLGDTGDRLIAALLKTINAKYPEAYLCCVCLMNLSILHESKRTLMYYVPPFTAGTMTVSENLRSAPCAYNPDGDPLNSPSSLLRSLEHMIVIYSAHLPSPVQSVEGQAVKWSMGLFRNLSTTVEHAKLVAHTAIPSVAGHLIRTSPRPLCKWTRDSFEDITLSFLVQLVQFPEVVAILNEQHKELSTCLSEVAERKGIHGVRAALIFSLLHKSVQSPLTRIAEH
jgi:hypothetical protein